MLAPVPCRTRPTGQKGACPEGAAVGSSHTLPRSLTRLPSLDSRALLRLGQIRGFFYSQDQERVYAVPL
jgi:hypothetical protein